MSDLIDKLIKLFGRWIILVLVLLGVLIGVSIWTIAHLTAEDGKRVSVLWGMVEYTKGKSQSKQEQEFSWPHTPNGKYEALEVQSENGWQYQVMEVTTQRTILITHGKFDTPNVSLRINQSYIFKSCIFSILGCYFVPPNFDNTIYHNIVDI